LFLKNETYGIFLFNSNSFDILDYFIRDYDENFKNDPLNEIEIIASWKLFGIHDSMILMRGKKSKSDLTNFMKYCRSFVNNYLFSWDKIPGNDNVKLIEFLKLKFRIDWVKTAEIKKINKGNTIKIFTKINHLSLNLNHEKTEVTLKIDDGRTDKFIVKMKNGKENIFVNKKYETPNFEGEKNIPDILKFSHKKIRVMEFWCDPLIPFKVEPEELKKPKPFLISFLRIKNFNVNNLIKISEVFDSENFTNDIVGLFQGYGLYDLIAIIKCTNYKDVQMKLNTLRAMKLDNTSNIDTSLFLDTASIITLSEQNSDFLMFSALLKIKPAQDKPEYWNEIKSIIEKTVIKNGITKFKCKLVISHRQGFFDLIITVRGHHKNYLTLLRILNSFPFIEDIATILRFDYFEA